MQKRAHRTDSCFHTHRRAIASARLNRRPASLLRWELDVLHSASGRIGWRNIPSAPDECL